MRPKLHNRTIVLGVALATVVVSSACVKSNPPGVGLVKVETAAVFGVDKDEPPAGFDTSNVDLGPEAQDLPLTELPTLNLTPRPTGPAPVSSEVCPTADTSKVFPKKSATVEVSDVPPMGVYTWKKILTAKATPQGSSRRLQVVQDQLETRAIRRVHKTTGSNHEFTFEMVSPSLAGSNLFDITSFLVNHNPELVVDQRVDSRTIGVVPVEGQDVRVAPPDDQPGIFITKLETQNANGNKVSGFTPLQPMLVLPLEEGIVRSGQTFTSIGVDPATGNVLVNDGVVGRTSRIDACGEVVEGYSVTLDQTFTGDFSSDPAGLATDLDMYGAREKTRTVDFTFALQYGALPIAYNLAIGDIRVDSDAFLGRWTLGGLTPAKLPDSTK